MKIFKKLNCFGGGGRGGHLVSQRGGGGALISKASRFFLVQKRLDFLFPV